MKLRRLVHRAHLHSALWEKVISTEGSGKPCTLRLGTKVVLVDPEEGEAILETGERVPGDLIIGADGVHVSVLYLSSPSSSKTNRRDSPNAARLLKGGQAMCRLIAVLALFAS